jgi:hypothetical protein
MYWAVRAAGTFEFREGAKRVAGGAAIAGAALLGAGALVPVGVYLVAFGAAEVAAYVALQVAWRHQPRRLAGVPWPFARTRREANAGPFLSVHPKAEAAANKAIRMVVHADELPLQLPVPSPALGPVGLITPQEVPAEAVALCLHAGAFAARARAVAG